MKSLSPRPLLRIEGAAVLIAACLLFGERRGSWPLFALLFLAPDLFMLGYIFGPGVGARAYNCGHTYTAPSLLAAGAWLSHSPALLPVCLIWAAHIGFDRFLGHGLKYETGFKDTHLAKVDVESSSLFARSNLKPPKGGFLVIEE